MDKQNDITTHPVYREARAATWMKIKWQDATDPAIRRHVVARHVAATLALKRLIKIRELT
jgi:hypothetical protein